MSKTKARSVPPSRDLPLTAQMDDAISVIQQHVTMAMWPLFDGHNIPYIGYYHRVAIHADDSCDRQEAIAYLQSDLQYSRQAVEACIPRQLNAAELAAIATFRHNVGPQYFEQSDVLRWLIDGDAFRIDASWRGWCYVRHNLDARMFQLRKAELRLFHSLD